MCFGNALCIESVSAMNELLLGEVGAGVKVVVSMCVNESAGSGRPPFRLRGFVIKRLCSHKPYSTTS